MKNIVVLISGNGSNLQAIIDGMEMDYVKNGLNEGFEFNNPNKKGECGCGESFTV